MEGDLKFSKPKRVVKRGVDYQRFKHQVHEADGWRCVVCLKRKPLTVHHLVKRSKTRLDILGNCVSVCVECHDLIENNHIAVRFKDVERRIVEVDHL